MYLLQLPLDILIEVSLYLNLDDIVKLSELKPYSKFNGNSRYWKIMYNKHISLVPLIEVRQYKRKLIYCHERNKLKNTNDRLWLKEMIQNNADHLIGEDYNKIKNNQYVCVELVRRKRYDLIEKFNNIWSGNPFVMIKMLSVAITLNDILVFTYIYIFYHTYMTVCLICQGPIESLLRLSIKKGRKDFIITMLNNTTQQSYHNMKRLLINLLIDSNDADMIKDLIGAKIITYHDFDRILTYAVEYSKFNIITYMIKIGAGDINQAFGHIFKIRNTNNRITIAQYLILHGVTDTYSLMKFAIIDKQDDLIKSLDYPIIDYNLYHLAHQYNDDYIINNYTPSKEAGLLHFNRTQHAE